MEALVMAGQLLLGLGLLVFVHELGHYLAARAFGIRVEKFYVFFDFWGTKLYSKKVGDTEYGIGWFPLGGYVKIAGMIDESLDKEQLKKEPEPWEFRSKPAWQRFIVMIGGITMNIIVGILIFAFHMTHFVEKYLPMENVKHGIYAHDLGRQLGFQTGDKVVAINGRTPERAKELQSLKVFFGAEVTVDRGGKLTTLDLPDTLFQTIARQKSRFVGFDNFPFTVDSVLPEMPAGMAGLEKGDNVLAVNDQLVEVYGQFREIVQEHPGDTLQFSVLRNERDTVPLAVAVSDAGLIGITAAVPYQLADYTFMNGLRYGTRDGFEAIYYNARALGGMFTGAVNPSESLQSPIGIAAIYGGVWDWQRFWYLTGLISFILAFMNILPIPALDGGHVVFIIIEVIQGKPLNDKTLERAQIVGMIVLLTLMAFAFGNDIYKFLK